jgi:CHAD domain-containing protein
VASRRLRERLVMVEQVEADVPARRARRQARDVTRGLGPLRELTVAVAAFDDATRRHDWPDARVTGLRRWVEKEGQRRRARAEAWLETFDDRRLSRMLRQTRDGLDQAIPERTWAVAITTRVIRRVREVERATQACGILYAPGRLHALRISIKKLRYALELAQQTIGLEAAAALRVLKRAQKHYGALHDMQVLLKLVTAAAAVGRGAALRMNANIVTDALERDCRDLHAVALRDGAALEALLQVVRRGVADAAAARKTPAGLGRRTAAEAHRASRPAAAAS